MTEGWVGDTRRAKQKVCLRHISRCNIFCVTDGWHR